MGSLVMYGNSQPDLTLVSFGADPWDEMREQVWTEDMLRPAQLLASANGEVTVELHYATPPNIDHLILGAHQHEPAGFRFSGGRVKLSYVAISGITPLLDEPIVAATNMPSRHVVPPMLAPMQADANSLDYTLILQLSGLTPLAQINIPQLWLGQALQLPAPSYGIDESSEIWQGTSFQSESGRTYASTNIVQSAFNIAWKTIEEDVAQAFIVFKNNHLRYQKPFWLFWNAPMDETGHWMRLKPKSKIKLPRTHAGYRALSLSVEEAL